MSRAARALGDYATALGYGPTQKQRDENLAKWGCIALVVAVPVGIFLRGLVIQQFWTWFVVPFGVLAITMPWALGISTFAWMLTGGDSDQREHDEPGASMWRAVGKLLGGPVVSFLLGWFWHSMM